MDPWRTASDLSVPARNLPCARCMFIATPTINTTNDGGVGGGRGSEEGPRQLTSSRTQSAVLGYAPWEGEWLG